MAKVGRDLPSSAEAVETCLVRGFVLVVPQHRENRENCGCSLWLESACSPVHGRVLPRRQIVGSLIPGLAVDAPQGGNSVRVRNPPRGPSQREGTCPRFPSIGLGKSKQPLGSQRKVDDHIRGEFDLGVESRGDGCLIHVRVRRVLDRRVADGVDYCGRPEGDEA